jgi:hypothetical protein
MEVEVNYTSVFLDVLFMMSGFGLAMKVTRNILTQDVIYISSPTTSIM